MGIKNLLPLQNGVTKSTPAKSLKKVPALKQRDFFDAMLEVRHILWTHSG